MNLTVFSINSVKSRWYKKGPQKAAIRDTRRILSSKAKRIADNAYGSERLFPSFEHFLSKWFIQLLLGKVASR